MWFSGLTSRSARGGPQMDCRAPSACPAARWPTAAAGRGGRSSSGYSSVRELIVSVICTSPKLISVMNSHALSAILPGSLASQPLGSKERILEGIRTMIQTRLLRAAFVVDSNFNRYLCHSRGKKIQSLFLQRWNNSGGDALHRSLHVALRHPIVRAMRLSTAFCGARVR